MADKIVLTVTPTGATQGMHFDNFPLTFLGPAKITRASEIIFNEDSQKWDITIPGQIVPYPSAMGFDQYNVARDFEVEWFQTCRQEGCEPVSREGRAVCERLRYRAALENT